MRKEQAESLCLFELVLLQCKLSVSFEGRSDFIFGLWINSRSVQHGDVCLEHGVVDLIVVRTENDDLHHSSPRGIDVSYCQKLWIWRDRATKAIDGIKGESVSSG